jgi:hypothetical protein
MANILMLSRSLCQCLRYLKCLRKRLTRILWVLGGQDAHPVVARFVGYVLQLASLDRVCQLREISYDTGDLWLLALPHAAW